jgi:uncharacterized SAM-binding protein YcdF (DUF218 family)
MKDYLLAHRSRLFLKILKIFLISMGSILTIAIILSMTNYPFWALHWLGTHNADLDVEPNMLVLMGGGGMPSADGLNRCYHAAETAHFHENCKIIIAIPSDTTKKEKSPEVLMAHELMIRGIDSTRFLFESVGTNTYTQVMKIKEMLSMYDPDTLAIRVITSPEHVLRSVAVFRKAGFNHVGGHPSFGVDIDKESLLDKKEMRHLKDGQLNLRYNMWNYLKYEITVVREYCAILYYKLRGWM